MLLRIIIDNNLIMIARSVKHLIYLWSAAQRVLEQHRETVHMHRTITIQTTICTHAFFAIQNKNKTQTRKRKLRCEVREKRQNKQRERFVYLNKHEKSRKIHKKTVHARSSVFLTHIFFVFILSFSIESKESEKKQQQQHNLLCVRSRSQLSLYFFLHLKVNEIHEPTTNKKKVSTIQKKHT